MIYVIYWFILCPWTICLRTSLQKGWTCKCEHVLLLAHVMHDGGQIVIGKWPVSPQSSVRVHLNQKWVKIQDLSSYLFFKKSNHMGRLWEWILIVSFHLKCFHFTWNIMEHPWVGTPQFLLLLKIAEYLIFLLLVLHAIQVYFLYRERKKPTDTQNNTCVQQKLVPK